MMDKAKEILDSLKYDYKTFLGVPNKYPEMPMNLLGRIHRWNPFVIYWAVALTICLIIWSFSQGTIALGGRFCIEGFTNPWNQTRYAYRLVTDEKWIMTGTKVPEGGCTADPLPG